jgi:glucose-1-phosphatase
MKKRNLIVFDLGRVLVRICDGWQHAFKQVGIDLPDDAVDSDTRAHLLKAVHKLETGRADVDVFCNDLASRLNLPCETVTAMWKGYCLGPYEGADALLRDLSTKGHATACLSNTNAQHWQTLTNPNDPHGKILKLLDHRFASHLIRARKPEQAIYAHVEMMTGYTPSKILFFDDVEENLVTARTQGWTAHLVERAENPIPAIRQILEKSRLL